MTAPVPPRPEAPVRVGVLLSGRGSNFLALHGAMERGEVPARVALVVSNADEAPGLASARDLGLEAVAIPHRAFADRERHEGAVLAALRAAGVEWVCLAGYLRLLSRRFVETFPERILNVHPSLLPAFPGLRAQEQALAHGVRVTGCTVHLVDAGLDAGPIVVQRAVEVREDDDLASLSARILAEEHRAYPEAVRLLLGRRWRVEGRRVVFPQGA
ncbi:MAG: phosphoribosylglycinamide formyltransferase [Thermoanaerobaculia bacterium]|nr:phosphoribosylglycinamide formyltransferase [Thermoanaerobaculia bacterium]